MEEETELFESCPAPTIEQARALEVPPHGLELADRELGTCPHLAVVLRPGRGSWQVQDQSVVGCEDADGRRCVLRHEAVDFGIGTPRVVVE